MTNERAAPLWSRDPRQLGKYEVVGRLGQGGMGTVYLAKDPSGTLVAVKVVRADLAPDDEFRRRFRSEVDRVRQVPPFCTAEVLDADPDHELPYLVVEYVDGPSLADVVQDRGPLTAANLHSVAIGVATALTAIHGAGVIHRDLKPRNVLLAPGSPKVIDFGIARALEATTGLTRTDQMVGTVAYMAPERFGDDMRHTLTPAADIFAWGGVVAYAGTGRTPFSADSPTATAARILTQPPTLDGLSGPLRDLVAHALEKDPANRPTARELLDLLVSGAQRTPAAAAALAHQPGLRAATEEAQAATGYDTNRQLTMLNPAPELAGVVDGESETRPVAATPSAPAAEPGGGKRGPARAIAMAAAVVLLAALAGVATLLAIGPPWSAGAGAPLTSATVTAPVPTPVITDSLVVRSLWQATSDANEKASCSFDGALVVRRESSGSFRCRGPQDQVPHDLRTEVDLQLRTPGSCASIWLRFKAVRGYQVRFCEKAVYVGVHKRANPDVYKTFPLDASPIVVGGPPTHVTVTIVGDTVEISRDGVALGTVPLQDRDVITDGRVVLGIFTEEGVPDGQPYEVAFRNVQIYPVA
ncbi:serine/threonine protein kinase [Krasilnikovia sp. MM14-A1004]|uniref:serine/threonine protein kinase n=1 Tax=Krasilnikovia sp. MM14-A1004 TaxID=3373541 RepID=UPI00399CAF0C